MKILLIVTGARSEMLIGKNAIASVQGKAPAAAGVRSYGRDDGGDIDLVR